jgi:hypothetical protein
MIWISDTKKPTYITDITLIGITEILSIYTPFASVQFILFRTIPNEKKKGGTFEIIHSHL